MLSKTQTIRCYHWPIDSGLVSDIPRRHKISVSLETTLLAFKNCLRFSVRLTDILTLRASSRRVCRVNKFNKNTFNFSFILNKAFQLIKTPISYFRSSGLMGLNTIFNSLQIFKFNRVVQAFSLFYNSFTNAVVFITLKFVLFFRYSLKLSFSSFCTFFLKIFTTIKHFFAVNFNISTAIKSTFRIYSNVDNTKINTQNAFCFLYLFFINIARTSYIKLLFDIKQLNFTSLNLKKLSLVCSALKRYFFSTSKSKNRYTIIFHKSKNTLIKWLSSILFKFNLSFFRKFIAMSYFSYTSNSHFSRKIKPFSNHVVNRFMQFKLIKYFVLKSKLRNIITGVVASNQSIKQFLMLFFTILQFDINRKFHSFFSTIFLNVKYMNYCLTIVKRFVVVLKNKISTFKRYNKKYNEPGERNV